MATSSAAERERASKLRSYDNAVIRLPPLHYVHILDINTNVTRLEVGPKNITCRDNERVVWGPEPMIRIAPRHYLVVENPVVTQLDKTGNEVVLFDRFGQARLKHGDQMVRLEQDPFPLYPGEKIVGEMRELQVVNENTALRLRAVRDLVDEAKGVPVKRMAGDEWLFHGPATYIPRVDIQIAETVQAVIVKPDHALRLRARVDFGGKDDSPRHIAGQEWLLKIEGAYLPDVHETLVSVVAPYVLTEKKGLHLKANRNFVDELGKPRKAGEQWLVTKADHELHLPNIHEIVSAEVELQVLKPGQYCTIANPYKDGKPQYGKFEVRQGPAQFFLLPGEELVGTYKTVYVLGAEQGLCVKAMEPCIEVNGSSKKKRVAGEKWYIYGPREYVPPVEMQVLHEVRAIIQLQSYNIYIFSSGAVLAALIGFLAIIFGLLRYTF